MATADLAGGAPWSDLEWTISVLGPSQDGPVEHQGRRWSVREKIVAIGGGPTEAAEAGSPSLLTFLLSNSGSGKRCAHIAICNEKGQLLPVFPPEAAKSVLHRVAPGQTLDLGHIRLELGAPAEAARIKAP